MTRDAFRVTWEPTQSAPEQASFARSVAALTPEAAPAFLAFWLPRQVDRYGFARDTFALVETLTERTV